MTQLAPYFRSIPGTRMSNVQENTHVRCLVTRSGIVLMPINTQCVKGYDGSDGIH